MLEQREIVALERRADSAAAVAPILPPAVDAAGTQTAIAPKSQTLPAARIRQVRKQLRRLIGRAPRSRLHFAARRLLTQCHIRRGSQSC